MRMKKRAPVLTAVLQEACRSTAELTKFSVLMAALIVLKAGNKHLCLLQSLIPQNRGRRDKRGKCPKSDQDHKRFQVTQSHQFNFLSSIQL